MAAFQALACPPEIRVCGLKHQVAKAVEYLNGECLYASVPHKKVVVESVSIGRKCGGRINACIFYHFHICKQAKSAAPQVFQREPHPEIARVEVFMHRRGCI